MPCGVLTRAYAGHAELRPGQWRHRHIRNADGFEIPVPHPEHGFRLRARLPRPEEGPLVVESPPNTLGIVDAFWFDYVTDLGNAGPDKGKGGKFLFLPPDYKGEVPEGYYVFSSPTFGNSFSGGVSRSRTTRACGRQHQPHLPASIRWRRRDRCGRRIHQRVGKGIQYHPCDGLRVSSRKSTRSCRKSRPTRMDPETLGLLAAIGIEKGMPFAPDDRMKAILD